MNKSEVDGSVTKWIQELKSGSSSAVPDIWNRYFSRLANFANAGMAKSAGRSMGGEDVAAEVLETIFRKVSSGKFPDLQDRSDLWRLLLKVAQCKMVSEKRSQARQKRGGGRVVLATDLQFFQNEAFDLGEIADTDPTLDSVMAIRDSYNYLIDVVLRDETTRTIARMKLEGLSNAEIAGQLEVVVRTIERKINLIRSLWAAELGINLEGGSHDRETGR